MDNGDRNDSQRNHIRPATDFKPCCGICDRRQRGGYLDTGGNSCRDCIKRDSGEGEMTIPLQHEDSETTKEWPRIVESCHFCRTKTRWWHENTNNPVCQKCAKEHRVAELPDYGKRIRALKRKSQNESNGE